MWKCTKCGRIFEKAKQMHSCKKVPLDKHFENKEEAKGIFDSLVKTINLKVGKSQIISLPCCIHLFGHNDYLAVLPKKDGLEIRFSLNRKLDSSRLKQAVPVSTKMYKNCIDIFKSEEIDAELIGWIEEAYHLEDNIKNDTMRV